MVLTGEGATRSWAAIPSIVFERFAQGYQLMPE
jgi:hypothetical protein